MKFRGKDVLTWSINNYLGLSNLPEVRKVDADASRDIEKEFAEAYGEEALKALQASPAYKKRPAYLEESE